MPDVILDDNDLLRYSLITKVQSSKFISISAKHLPLAIYIDFKLWQRQSYIVKQITITLATTIVILSKK